MEPKGGAPFARGGKVGTVASILALALAAAALVVALAIRAPPGPTGPPGPDGTQGERGAAGSQGPAGSAGADGLACWDLNQNGAPDLAEDLNKDTLVNVDDCVVRVPPGPVMAGSTYVGNSTIRSVCTVYTGGIVTISVPQGGNVVVSATVRYELTHRAGTEDLVQFAIEDAQDICAADAGMYQDSVPASEPDGTHRRSGSLHDSFWFPNAGLYNFYLNGIMLSGQDPGDRVVASAIYAVYYPA